MSASQAKEMQAFCRSFRSVPLRSKKLRLASIIRSASNTSNALLERLVAATSSSTCVRAPRSASPGSSPVVGVSRASNLARAAGVLS